MSIHRVPAIPGKFKKGRKARTSAAAAPNTGGVIAPVKAKRSSVSEDDIDRRQDKGIAPPASDKAPGDQ